MLISASYIKKPRKHRHCDDCGKPIEGRTVRLYGAAERSDKPYPIYLHPDCLTWPEAKKKLTEVGI